MLTPYQGPKTKWFSNTAASQVNRECRVARSVIRRDGPARTDSGAVMSRKLSSRMLQRGVATIEAAFLLIPLVILLLGIAELGRVFYQYNTIAKATRDGAATYR